MAPQAKRCFSYVLFWMGIDWISSCTRDDFALDYSSLVFEGPSTQARFPWIWLSMLDAISWESSRTDSFTLNVNRLPGISTLSYYPSEARKGSCFRFGHQPNTNVEVSQDAEFGAKLWKVPCNILPSYTDKFVSGNSDLSSVNKYREVRCQNSTSER